MNIPIILVTKTPFPSGTTGGLIIFLIVLIYLYIYNYELKEITFCMKIVYVFRAKWKDISKPLKSIRSMRIAKLVKQNYRI